MNHRPLDSYHRGSLHQVVVQVSCFWFLVLMFQELWSSQDTKSKMFKKFKMFVCKNFKFHLLWICFPSPREDPIENYGLSLLRQVESFFFLSPLDRKDFLLCTIFVLLFSINRIVFEFTKKT